MNAELEAIKDSWDKSTGDGRDDEGTRALCDAYVEAHPEQFTELRNLSIESIVKTISVFRAAGMEEQQWIAEAWQLHHFAAQQIGGEYHPQVRIPGVTE